MPDVRSARLRPSRLRRLLLVICILITGAAAAGIRPYVLPQIDPLRKADAILILGGWGYDRYRLGLQLADEGWAPTVMVSNPNGASDGWLTHYCTTTNPKFTLHCFDPDPETTRGEGQELRRLANEHGWRTVIVVTFRPHISRARYILEKCFDGDLIMVDSQSHIPPQRWVLEYIFQTAGYIRAALQPGC